MSQPQWAGVLLDIEGTTSAIDFVYQTMFPFVRRELATFLASHNQRADVQQALAQIAAEGGWTWSPAGGDQPAARAASLARVEADVLGQMDRDAKTTGLKALQGLIWANGFASGELVSHVYDDVLPALQAWQRHQVPVCIYSSGSIAAQRLFFGHTQCGDLLPYLSGHYDTTSGGKRDADSYRRIAAAWGKPPTQLLFVSDVAEELAAARQAGLEVALAVRPGNPPQSEAGGWLQISNFQELPSGPPA